MELSLLLLLTVITMQIGAALVGSSIEWIEQRQLTAYIEAHISQNPQTSLLRAGNAPASPREVLVRPALLIREDDPRQLLRAIEKA